MAEVLRGDAEGQRSIALLAVGPPPIDAALALAARGLEGVTIVEPLLEGNRPLLEPLASALGWAYVAREYAPEEALEMWGRLLPYLGEPAASLRALAHLLGVRAIPPADLYVSSMGLPARLEGPRRLGLGRHLRLLFGGGAGGPRPAAPPDALPGGSRAAYTVLEGLVRHEGKRFSLPLTSPALAAPGLGREALGEEVRRAGHAALLAALPGDRSGDGFPRFVREAVLPALEAEGRDGPRWLRQGAAAELLRAPERAAKEHPVGPLFLLTLLGWMRSVGAEVE